jgi:hypothetical protein
MVSFTPWPLYPRERYAGTHWTGGWVSPRAVLDAVVKRKIPRPRQERSHIKYDTIYAEREVKVELENCFLYRGKPYMYSPLSDLRFMMVLNVKCC